MVSVNPRGLMLMTIGIFFLAALVPAALETIFAVDTANWTTATIALWALIPLAIIGFLVLAFVPGGKGGAT